MSSALGQAPGQGLEQAVGPAADHVGGGLGQCPVVDRVDQVVAVLGGVHVDPGHDVDREGLRPVPLLGEHAVGPRDPQVADFDPVAHCG